MGPKLKDDDVITIYLDIPKAGFHTRHVYGFATPKFKQFNEYNPDNAAFVQAEGAYGVKNEFQDINDRKELSKNRKGFGFKQGEKAEICISVNMKERIGCIWNSMHKVVFSLPDEVRIILGFAGNDAKETRIRKVVNKYQVD